MKKLFILMGLFLGMGLVLAKATRAADAVIPGKALYDGKCAACHGKDAKGNPMMEKMFKLEPGALSLVSKTALGMASADEIAIVKKGKGKMPASPALADKDIKDALTYAKSMGGPVKEPMKKTEAAPTAPAVAAGTADLTKTAELYTAKCSSCHGADGKGKEAMANMFKVEMAKLDLVDADTQGKTDAALDEATTKGVGKMPAYGGKISDDDIKSLTAYIRKLAGK